MTRFTFNRKSRSDKAENSALSLARKENPYPNLQTLFFVRMRRMRRFSTEIRSKYGEALEKMVQYHNDSKHGDVFAEGPDVMVYIS